MQVFITGAAGRLGTMLRILWADSGSIGFDPVWCSRKASGPDDVFWDILSGPAPGIAEGSVILHLAGTIDPNKAASASNTELALKVCDAARSARAAHVFLASSAAVYGSSPVDHVEIHAPAPVSAYGRSKLDMEREALCWAHRVRSDAPGVTCLRIGNVLGADALFGKANTFQITELDRLPSISGGPVRSYIPPQALAGVLAELVRQAGAGHKLPQILNIASPGPVAMADLLHAADIQYQLGTANPHTIPRVGLSTKRLAALVPLDRQNAKTMVADWRGFLALSK